jgi:hypothetical protein
MSTYGTHVRKADLADLIQNKQDKQHIDTLRTLIVVYEYGGKQW